ncbi:hypothetical protein DXN05_24060 [Deminuibacter soli]|uniref:Uncharacterized protein n=1 Tax=Deminuibacter soli TaxID=2291815 RepID=A0A3E1NCS2_9BACT|nr:hypothetical protein DXN05_24060 [Deminuibacter soli]
MCTSAQRLSKPDRQRLTVLEDTLKKLGQQMIYDVEASRRFAADSSFIRTLVKALHTPYSFDYDFDSVQTVSTLYAPDTTFRVFTWQFQRDDDYYRQRGAIQMKTADGSLKLFPLIDMSDFTQNPVDSVRSNLNWIGAIYYGIVMKKAGAKKYYTLLGFDDNNMRSTKKWIDVLTFDEAGNPHFGGQYFDYKNDSLKPAQPAYRFCLEYKKEGRARMAYDPEMDMIIFDHLVSEDNNQSKRYTLIPDGDYEGFKWQNGHWAHVSKVFTYKLTDGHAPQPTILKDDEGKSDEKKLLEQSLKNMQKAQPANQSKKFQKNQRTDPRQGTEN